MTDIVAVSVTSDETSWSELGSTPRHIRAVRTARPTSAADAYAKREIAPREGV